MTTTYTQALSRYNGNGVTTQWSVGFPYTNSSEVKVYLKVGNDAQVLLDKDVDYSFIDDETILFPKSGSSYSVLTSSDILAIQRESTFSSEYTFDNQQRLYPVEVMNADDMEMRHLQELKRDIDRSIKLSPTSRVDVNELLDQVERVYESIDNIDTNANNIGSINTNATNISDINTTATNIADVNTVAQNVLPINNVSQNIIAINDVARDLVEDHYIETVAGIKDDVVKVANIDDKVVAVADNETNINANANNMPDIVINATAIEEIKKVADISMEVSNVNDIADEIVAVDGNKTNIDIVANSIDDIKAKMNVDFSNNTAPDKLVPTPTTENTALIYKNGVIGWGKAAAEGDNLTITTNAQDKIQTVAMIDAVDDTKLIKTAYVTQDWYDEHFALNDLDDDTDYITDSEVSTNVKSFRNVGDKFETLRTDTYLNGAVECDGSQYYTADFIGEQNIGRLFQQGKLPYVSYADYANAIATDGYCEQFAYDGGDTFKVPTIKRILVKDIVPVKGNGMTMGLTDGTNQVALTGFYSATSGPRLAVNGTLQGYPVGTSNSAYGAGNMLYGLTADATKSGIIADLSNNHAVYIRTMIQLATQTTDEAIATMTQMRAELDSLKALPRIIDRQPTATGGYTVCSDGYYEEWGKGIGQITFSKTMKDTKYHMSVTNDYNSGYSGSHSATTTGVIITQSQNKNCYWKVSGFLAEGEY